MPTLSPHFSSRAPSDIRLAQIEFAKRTDGVTAISTAIGNVSLPMHPAMQQRMFNLQKAAGELKEIAQGVLRYTPTVGTKESRDAFLKIIAASGGNTNNLHVQITDGGSQAMELVILGCCGPAGSDEKPLMVIDAAYTNYKAMADRVGRRIVSIQRTLREDGKFTLPNLDRIRETIDREKPGALVVIPYDNPTGHFYNQETLIGLAKLCVEKDLWLISDEAYRELHYTGEAPSSAWNLSEKEVPGIRGRRISIESASKLWNACGLRVGAIVTDNVELWEKSVAENTANLSPNSLGQYIFGALAHEKKEDLEEWFKSQREYYQELMEKLTNELRKELPGVIVSSPDASIYSVVDVRKIAKTGFSGKEFALFCAQKGAVEVNGQKMTLLVSPMAGSYNVRAGEKNPGETQMRIAYVAKPEEMKWVPMLFSELFKKYEANRYTPSPL